MKLAILVEKQSQQTDKQTNRQITLLAFYSMPRVGCSILKSINSVIPKKWIAEWGILRLVYFKPHPPCMHVQNCIYS